MNTNKQLDNLTRCVVCHDFHEKGSYHKRMKQMGFVQIEISEFVCDGCIYEYSDQYDYKGD